MKTLHTAASTLAIVGGLIAGTTGAALLGAGTAHAITGDPYNSNGVWLVPSEIAPGTYRVNSTGSGYSKVCADYTCEIGTDGFISNEIYSGPGVLVIPSNAVSVELKRISLTRMG